MKYYHQQELLLLVSPPNKVFLSFIRLNCVLVFWPPDLIVVTLPCSQIYNLILTEPKLHVNKTKVSHLLSSLRTNPQLSKYSEVQQCNNCRIKVVKRCNKVVCDSTVQLQRCC